LAGSGGTVAVLHVNGADQQGAQMAVANALTQDPTINGVLATGIEGYSAVSAAVKGLNAGGRIKVGTFDVSVDNPNNLAAVQSGDALFVVDQQPFLQGYDAVQLAAFQARFGQHPFRPVYTGPSLVTKDNAAKVMTHETTTRSRGVGMVTHGQAADPFWAQVQKGAQQAATDFNVDLRYSSPPTTDPQAQAKLITDAAAQKPAAMVVTIPDPAALTAPIKQASAAGIPVIVANVGLNQLDQVGGLTTSGRTRRWPVRRRARRWPRPGSPTLCVIHEEQNAALTDRCDGFSKRLTNTGGTVKVLHVNGAQLHDAQQAVENALQQDPSINGILATGLPGFSAAGGALQAMNAFGKVKLRVVRRLDHEPGGRPERPRRSSPSTSSPSCRATRRCRWRRSRRGSASTRSSRSTPGRAWSPRTTPRRWRSSTRAMRPCSCSKADTRAERK
jgi:ABC-type sugar transport system substrate-binding protein